ncbi:hypothetical protein QM312_11305 [Burkholderia cenocepacia]|uniref:hypothetical protein n=1 Tax=Burkholderia cenocepacia TaxID=95486 RepID=UPI0024B75382|nr:hypothetical protein [Burkholderia cenocepacia]MDI9696509.1 hypothetical protein [Burkholderia cenocepacia]
MAWLRTRWKGMACQVGGIAICTIVAKNYMPTTVSPVRIPCGAWGLVGRARERPGEVVRFRRNDSEKCAESIFIIPVFISGQMDWWNRNGPNDEFVSVLSKFDGAV